MTHTAENDAAAVLREHALDYDEARRTYVCICGTYLPLDGNRVPFSDHQAATLAAAGLLRTRPIPSGGTGDE